MDELNKHSEAERVFENATQTLAFVNAFFEVTNHKPFPEPFRECEIASERVPFDFCAEIDLEKAIEFYDNADYIGSGHRTWYNGVLNEWDKLHHFFRKK